MAASGRLSSGSSAGGHRPRAPRRLRWTGAAILLLVLFEIVGIIAMTQWIGGGWTFLALVLGSALGVLIVAKAGRRAWRAFRQDAVEGIVPGRDVGDPVLLLVAGLLWVVPGFVSDVLGLLLMLPPTRSVARRIFRVVFGWRVPPGVRSGQPVPGMEAFRAAQQGQAGRRDSDVIEGEVVDPDPPQHP